MNSHSLIRCCRYKQNRTLNVVLLVSCVCALQTATIFCICTFFSVFVELEVNQFEQVKHPFTLFPTPILRQQFIYVSLPLLYPGSTHDVKDYTFSQKRLYRSELSPSPGLPLYKHTKTFSPAAPISALAADGASNTEVCSRNTSYCF